LTEKLLKAANIFVWFCVDKRELNCQFDIQCSKGIKNLLIYSKLALYKSSSDSHSFKVFIDFFGFVLRKRQLKMRKIINYFF
jgi:hypothetical protein